MCLVRKTPKSSLMVVCYAKLTEIFWISSNHLYHAYAWLKLFSLQKGFNKNLSQKDLQLIASSVVLAALSVPPYNHLHGASHLELENEKERNLKITNLIAFDVEPKAEASHTLSRSSLLTQLVSKGVVSCATQEVKDIYHLLEHEFIPLDLASKVQALLNKISKLGGKVSSASSVPDVQLSQYVPDLEKLATLRLLQQASQVYQTVKIENLSRMICFFDFAFVEKVSVDAIKHGFISMKVDHMQGSVSFSQKNLDFDGLRDHLALFAESLNNARAMVYSPMKKAHKLGQAFSGLSEAVEKEHKKDFLHARLSLRNVKRIKRDNFWRWNERKNQRG